MAFLGPGQNDSGGQANPGAQTSSLIWANIMGFTITLTSGLPAATRGPTNPGVIYQLSGSVVTSGFGQIFPTGRT